MHKHVHRELGLSSFEMSFTPFQGVSCPFFHRVQQKMGSQAQLRQLGLTTAWDIEDLSRLGKKVKVCALVCRLIIVLLVRYMSCDIPYSNDRSSTYRLRFTSCIYHNMCT